MMLGKRPRPPMKRTTSMTEITFDLNSNSQAPPPKMCFGGGGGGGGSPQIQSGGGLEVSDQRFLSTVSPRNRRYSGDFTEETAHFLRSCCLCKRRLVPGHDIYMYRGNSGFCSKECRQQQMNEDEKKNKCSLVSKKEGASSTTGSKAETDTAL